jgi:spermidine/putrescine-binding protein
LGDVKIGMYASARDSIAAGLLYNGKSLNTKDGNELQAAGDALFGMNYHAWATDDLKTGVAIGKYDLALVYSGDFFDTLYSAYDVEDEEVDITFDMVAPKTNNVFFDAMVIPRNSMNEELAYKFINFMIAEENALQNAQYVGYCPTIKSVFEEMLADPEYEGIADLEVYYPGNITNGEIYQYLGTKTYSLYDSIYKKVKK